MAITRSLGRSVGAAKAGAVPTRTFAFPLAALELHVHGRGLVVVRVVVSYAPLALFEEHVGIVSGSSSIVVVVSNVVFVVIVSWDSVRYRSDLSDRYSWD